MGKSKQWPENQSIDIQNVSNCGNVMYTDVMATYPNHRKVSLMVVMDNISTDSTSFTPL